MKQKIKKIIVLSIITMISVIFLRCQKDDDSSNLLQEKIQTVTIDEAKNFLQHSKTDIFGKSINSKLETLEFSKTTQEKIKGSNQLLTVIPLATDTNLKNDRVLLLKVNDEIKSAIFSMYPDENSVKGKFSGTLFSYSLDGNFISGFRAKNGIIISQFVGNNNTTARSSIQLKEVTVERNLVYALDVFGCSTIFDGDIYGGGGFYDGVLDFYSWDAGAGYRMLDSPEVKDDLPPSCESFNFTSKRGANWQEALVKNISFTIDLVTPPKHIQIKQIITYPQPVSFGMPISLNKGNDITSGVAATVSARILQLAMDRTVQKYGNSEVSELTVKLYFQKQLADEYRDYANGGIVNFNSTSNIAATEYKTNLLSSGDCD